MNGILTCQPTLNILSPSVYKGQEVQLINKYRFKFFFFPLLNTPSFLNSVRVMSG